MKWQFTVIYFLVKVRYKSVPISVLRNLELEANNIIQSKHIIQNALLTRCYVKHFLSPYIDSEVNHNQHLIKIPFINKGMECVDSRSILKDNFVISSIPKTKGEVGAVKLV